MAVKNLIGCFLDDEDMEEFAEWAFGPEYQEMEGLMTYMQAWNSKHGDKLMLYEINQPIKDIPKMIKIWKNIEI